MSTIFSVMTWNLENFFTPGALSGSSKVISQADFDGKLAFVAERILKTKPQPDVIAFQELGVRAGEVDHALLHLQRSLKGKYPHLALSANPDKRGIRVGFLSKHPLQNLGEVVDFPPGELDEVADWNGKHIGRMGRGALKVEVEPQPGLRVRLIAAHLKSKLINYPSSGNTTRFAPLNEAERARGEGLGLLRRTAEAVALRSYVAGLMELEPAAHTIVLGDLNDEPGAGSTQLLLGPADTDITRADGSDWARLYNLGVGLPLRGSEEKYFLRPSERYSRMYQGQGELIDHILASKGLVWDAAGANWKVQKVRIFVKANEGQNVTDNPNLRVGSNAPDHAPVYASFAL